MDKIDCPICDSNDIREAVACEELTLDGHMVEVPGVHFSVCDACGEEFFTAAQARASQVKFTDAKRRALGLLSGVQIKRLRKHFGLTQRQASQVFGGGVNSFSKYERGEVVQSKSIDRLLRLAGQFDKNIDLLCEWEGIEPVGRVQYLDDKEVVVRPRFGERLSVRRLHSECMVASVAADNDYM